MKPIKEKSETINRKGSERYNCIGGVGRHPGWCRRGKMKSRLKEESSYEPMGSWGCARKGTEWFMVRPELVMQQLGGLVWAKVITKGF